MIDATKYLPAHVRESIDGENLEKIKFSRPERGVMREVKFTLPSVWAPKHRKVTDGDYSGGYISFDIAPHMPDILDAAAQPYVRIIAIMAAAQTAKTTTVDTFLGWTLKHKTGRILSVYPDETTGTRAMKKRIQKMVDGSPQLAKLKTGRKEDESSTSLQLTSSLWEIGWAGSPTSTADRSVKYLDLQEVDKYSVTAGKKEGGVIEYAKLRTRAYPDTHKIFITSSPSDMTGNIAVTMEKEIEAVFVKWVKCPVCGYEQLMRFSKETFTWPKGEDGESVDRKKIFSKKLGRYVCQNKNCSVKWTDDLRDVAVKRKNSTWRLRVKDSKDGPVKGPEMHAYMEKHRPRSIGQIWPSWISPLVSLSEVCHDFLRCSDKTLSPEERFVALKDFKNKHEAQPWSWVQEEKPVKVVLKLRDERPEGMVPGGDQVAGLVAGVDTQDYSFWFWIMAVGYGLVNDQWLIRCGEVMTFDALKRILWQDQYCDVEGNVYPVRMTFMDSAGHRTDEVYRFCAEDEHRGLILPTKGRDKLGAKMNINNIEFFPRTKTPVPGGLQLVNINTTHYKNAMDVKLGLKHSMPGAIRFHAEFAEDHAEHLIAEARNAKGVWEQIGRRPNHLLDCWEGAWAAADHEGLCYLERGEGLNQQQEEEVITFQSGFIGG